MTREDLIAFEDEMAADFEAGRIKAPLHLAGGNEDTLLKIFEDIRSDDYVLVGWRSHYHCLLKGVPPDELRAAIHAGRSIALCFPKQHVLCSAIVGGICPIAVGLAWAIKKNGIAWGKDRLRTVHVFVGDMTEMSGIFHESYHYSRGHSLPVIWHVEDNGLSVCTNTREAWGENWPWENKYPPKDRYQYHLTRPHVGIGRFVSF